MRCADASDAVDYRFSPCAPCQTTPIISPPPDDYAAASLPPLIFHAAFAAAFATIYADVDTLQVRIMLLLRYAPLPWLLS